MATGAVWAQASDEGAPIIVGERREGLKAYHLERLELAFRFDARWREDRIRTIGQAEQKNTEEIYTESIDLSSRSFIGHRNLVDLTVDLSIGWEDSTSDSETTGLLQRDSGVVTTYNINALILAESATPTTIYALKTKSLFDREFAGSIDSTNSEYGVIVRTFEDFAPTSFHYFHREQLEDSQLSLADYSQKQDTFSIHTQWSPTDTQRLLIEYAFDIVEERQASTFVNDYNRHDATITHTWDFGPENAHNLRSTARLYDQDGPYGNRTLRLDESLRLQHSDTFDTRYDVTIEDRSVISSSQQRYRASVTARHRLFDSLVTTANVGAERVDVPEDDYHSVETFGSLNFDYTKQVPYGRFFAAVSLGYDRINNSERGSPVTILDERVTFNDPLPAIIARRNIERSSVVVTNISNTRFYVEGIDYTLRWFPDRIELYRIVGGAIADGQSVAVDYEIGPEPRNSIETLSHGISLRYGIDEGPLEGLSAYMTYREINQDLETIDPSRFTLNDTTRLLLGVELRRGPITLLAEREDVNSVISPYELVRLSARYDQRLGIRSWFTADVSHEMTEFGNTGSTVELDRISVEYAKMLTSGLHARARLQYRDESDSIGVNTRGFEQVLELNFSRRQTDIYATIRNSMLEGDRVDTNSQTFSFGLRRAF